MVKKVFILFLFLCFNLNAQIVINKPTLGFTQACASATFNNYNLSFTFFPASNLLPGNQFIIELSDASGSFSNPTTLKSVTSATSPVNTSFSFPTTVYGKNYIIRIRSTNPAATSTPSNSFPAFYAIYNQSFTINSNKSTVRICNNQPVALSVDSGFSSPLQYPQLTYRWYKDNVVIAGENTSTLNATQTGNYYVEVDYGSCSYNAYSNLVAVTNGVLTPVIQTTDLSNQLCEGTPKQIVCSEQNSNYTYKWYKDGVLIVGATTYTYTALQPGTYKVVVSDSGCDFNSNDLTLVSQPISASIGPLATNIIIPGQQLVLNSVTNAAQPSFTWYRNNILISGQTNSTLTITQNGTYKVIAKQNQGCLAEQSAETTVVYPGGFDLGIKNTAPYTQCQSITASLSIDKFSALTSSTPVNILGNNYGYGYKWYKNGIAVSGATSTILNLTSSLNNGSYKLGVTIPDFGEIFSNTVDVQLKITDDITITNNVPLCQNGDSIVLQSKLTNPNYTYDWYFNGTKVATNTSGSYTVTQAGSYYLIVGSGSCSLQSNTLNLQAANFNVSISSSSMLIIPGQQLNLTAITDAVKPVYSWYKDGVLLTGQTGNILSVTKNGIYKVTIKQTQGCLVEKSTDITILYPTGFDLGIKNTAPYTQCQSTSAILTIEKFSALAPSGPIDILGNNYGYGYKWYRNGIAVSGATSAILNLTSPLDNGSYKLGVTIPDFGEIFSNTLDIQLKITEDVTITNNVPLCQNGDSVVLQSKLTNPNYNYDWYLNGVKVASNTTGSYTVTQAGNYYLIVRNGSCSLQSNTLNLQLANFNLAISSSSTLIIPGQQLNLTATTDAIQPVYSWYKDGVLLSGQTGNVLSVTKNGTYKVIVKQTQGCLIEKSTEIIILYPTGFDLSTKNTVPYTQCQSTSATLSVDKFSALTPSGPVNILGNNYGYGYQWYKNAAAISGATSATLNLTNALDNGSYKLGVTIPDFGEIFSNVIDVQLKITEDVTITNNVPLCQSGDSVVLQSKLTNPNYIYDWYSSGTKVASNTSGNYTVTQAGNYYLIVRNGSCSLQSNTLNLQASNFNLNISSSSTLIIPGQQLDLTATTDAIQPVYSWYKDGVLLSGQAGNILSVTKNGTYKVIVKQNQGCVIEKSSEITILYPTGFDLGIKNTVSYTQCQSTSATLAIDKFSALTSSGPVSILNNNLGYNYQWYKNGAAVSGATSTLFNITNALDNGSYKLGVTIPDFGEIFSNIVDVQLKITEDITITNNVPFCQNGDSVVLQSKLTNPNYTYDWYFNGTKVSTNTSGSYTVTQAGSYYMIVRSGTCSLQSNTINLQEGGFGVYISPETPFIVPGQTMLLTSNTDAFHPTFAWYKNGIILNGENSSTLKISGIGIYKVVVNQTQGCLIEKSSEITIGYPSGFTVTIAPDSDYQECKSTTTTLKFLKLVANSTFGNVDLTNNPYSYTFQWYKNNVLIPGAISPNLSISDFSENADYKLQVIIPDFPNVYSSTIKVLLGFSTPLSITQTGVFCDEGSEVTLTGSYTDLAFSYQWFESSSSSVLGTQNSITINKSGKYYLKVSQNGCSLSSNIISIAPYNFSEVTVDAPEKFSIPKGSEKVITATGADSYQWYFNDQLVSESNSYKVTQEGTYKLIVKVGDCDKTFTFEVTYLENKFVISNTVTPNGDGFNDYWSIPLEYAYKDSILVTIYDASGNIAFRSVNYQNNWPEGNFQFPQTSPVFYFIIEKVTGGTLKDGSITVIK